ncbi:hypothetical protein JVT61DRAFT_11192 [Boletus reticuloceps]|uniref:F-box domain-containing protein n=1 Tax=Boletus reticuloceps TaxID=495285 RepID=A0A8I2YF50_9AGAM|nr:hypothetical protein JVT61DRAFT_11192 [Boletus reticuloceps]
MSRKTPEMIDKVIELLTAQLGVLQRREDDFTRILEDMTRLQSSVRAEREALGSKITELESQKQPINWLPTELLVEIFLIRTEDESTDMTVGLPYNPAPVVISHVCHKWRQLTLATSRLWSFISYRTSHWRPQLLSVFLQRAESSPISFNFISTPSTGTSNNMNTSALEAATSIEVIRTLSYQRRRFRSLTFECGFAKSMEHILEGITRLYYPLHELESLDLAISTLDPSFEGTQLLASDRLSTDQSSPASSVTLRHLRLQQMPLSILPAFLVRSIRTLELSYSPKKSQSRRLHHFTFKISHLTNLLRYTPQLHELSLVGVTPAWDVITRHPTNGQLSLSHGATEPHNLVVVSSFELPELKHLEWKYAYHRDVFPLMSLIVLPRLERWDLFIAQSPTKRSDATQFRGNHIHDQDSFIQAEPLSNVLVLHALQELDVNCQNEDTLGSSLRQFLFPSLAKLDVTFVGQHIRKASGLPSLPRLESIFRDPRLPHLTHLSISNFDISPGHGKSMLGYMPNLLSLTFGTCTGVNVVLDALAEAYGCAPTTGGVRTRSCGVRVCPRLEDLILWSCPDFDFRTLWSTVHARSLAPDDAGDEPRKEALEAEVFASAVLGRKIRPLKKTHSSGARPSQQHLDPSGLWASTSSRSTLIPMQEALHPSRLACLHLEDCPQISHHEALSLGRWGTMVIYR